MEKKKFDTSGEIVVPTGAAESARRAGGLLRGLLAVAAGFSAKPPGWFLHHPAGNLQQAVFLYCVKGGGWCKAAGRIYGVRKGDLVVLPEDMAYSCASHVSAPWAAYWVRAEGEHLEEYIRELTAGVSTPVLHVGEDPHVVRLYTEILVLLRRGFTFSNLLQGSNALAYLLALVVGKRQGSPLANLGTAQKVADAIIYMTEHLDDSFRVSELARIANVSVDYFTRLFKEQTGCSPREYLHLLRIHRACELLEAPGRSMKEIATSLGYRDSFHFSRQFKAFHGRSPTQYRQSRGY